jgi:hypothetical protein
MRYIQLGGDNERLREGVCTGENNRAEEHTRWDAATASDQVLLMSHCTNQGEPVVYAWQGVSQAWPA